MDDKRTFIDGKGDIPDIIAKFNQREAEKFDDRKANCFFVPIEEIKANNYDLSVSMYKEIEYEEVKYNSPASKYCFIICYYFTKRAAERITYPTKNTKINQ